MSYLPADYETVADRLVRWWAKYPDGCIETTMVHYDAKTVVFRAMSTQTPMPNNQLPPAKPKRYLEAAP